MSERLPPPLVEVALPGGPEWVAEEWPVALEYNGISQAVMLASPQDLEDFALGFSLSEGLLEEAGELLDLQLQPRPQGLALALRVTARAEQRLKARRRQLAGRTGCGLCGVESLEQVFRPLASPLQPLVLPSAVLGQAMRGLSAAQPLQQRAGGLHAAAWCDLQGQVLLVREDVGRHNALDKLLGALQRAGHARDAGFVAVTSRASFEMVQKSATLGVRLLAAVSAPTHQALRCARDSGVALAAFVREGRATYYHPSDMPAGTL